MHMRDRCQWSIKHFRTIVEEHFIFSRYRWNTATEITIQEDECHRSTECKVKYWISVIIFCMGRGLSALESSYYLDG